MTVSDRRRVATLGETMALVRSRDIGSLRHASDLALGVGGAESNVAIALRRLGLDVTWLGRVGDDSLGERVVREIRAEGVDARAVVDAGAPTGLMLKERPHPTSTRVLYYRSGSAGSRLSPSDLPDGWIEQADLLHLTGITALISESARETLSVAIDRARAAGVVVTFDINYRSSLAAPAVAGPWLREVAERADIVFGGAEEFERMPRPRASASSRIAPRRSCSSAAPTARRPSCRRRWSTPRGSSSMSSTRSEPATPSSRGT